ncbi:hypothetical protein GCM10010234_16700 [Streptomyces hawaiiensis]
MNRPCDAEIAAAGPQPQAARYGCPYGRRTFDRSDGFQVARQETPGGGCDRSTVTRTAHHLPPSLGSRGWGAHDFPSGAPWRSLVLHDLRYSARSFTDAARESRRPQPLPVRRTVEVHAFARRRRDHSIAEWSAREERRARQRLRAQVGTLMGWVHDGVDELALDAVDSVDIPSARHRRSALWHA